MEELITKKIYEDTDFITIIADLLQAESVQEMKKYRQHYKTSCFNHCLCVSYYTYLICRKLNLDYISASRAAMLHDLFLYDWRKRENDRKGLHAFTHPKTALENATKLFSLNDKEKDMILKHMWPITFIPPKYIESYILTFVDKHCAISESVRAINDIFSKKTAFRYAYVFFTLLFINF